MATATTRVISALVVPIALLLGSCGGGGGGGGGPAAVLPQLSGTVAKGPVSGAVITVFELNANGSKGSQVGTGVSTGNGTYAITLTRATELPLLLEAAGGSYVDEATGATVNLAASDVFKTVLIGVPDPLEPAQIAITPLTTIAAARAIALAQDGVPLAAAIAMANTAVAQQYRLDNIVTIQAVNASNANDVRTAEQQRRDYGLVLAGIAELANGLGVSAIELTRALATDLSDGTLDGMNGATAITMQAASGGAPVNLPATAGTSDLQAAIASFAASGRNVTNLTDPTIATFPVRAGSTASNPLRVLTTALPIFTSAQAGSVTVVAEGGTPPYTCSLGAGSTLPDNFTLSPNCVVSGSELLASGTTRRIYPQFVVIVTDSGNPAMTASVPLFISIVAAAPSISCNAVSLTQGEAESGAAVAQASGGTPPYYFRSDSFFSGAPPLGMTVEPVPEAGGFGNVGLLGGTPGPGTGRASAYTFGVCVVDAVGAGRCCTASGLVAAPPAPVVSIGLSPSSLSFTAVENGANPDNQVVEVTNSGSAGTTLAFTITDNASWLTLQGSQSGLAAGETAPFAVIVNTAGLSVANSPYTATISVSDPNAQNSPQTVGVTLVIQPATSIFSGPFSGSGSVTNTNPSSDGSYCNFTVQVSGEITVAIDSQAGGQASGTGTATGTWTNSVNSGFCNAGSGNIDGSGPLSGTLPAMAWSGGSFPLVDFTGELNSAGTQITGTAIFTYPNTTGQIVSNVTLNVQ